MKTVMRILASSLTLALLPLAARADTALPVSTGVVTSGVGWRQDPFGSGKTVFHRGTDIAVPSGTKVRATRAGRVVFAGKRGGYGTTVILAHGNGQKTLYGHNSFLEVQPGDWVKAGEVIALSGNSGRSTGPHVHYEVLRGGQETAGIVRLDSEMGTRTSSFRSDRQRLERKMDEIVSSILHEVKDGGLLGESGSTGS